MLEERERFSKGLGKVEEKFVKENVKRRHMNTGKRRPREKVEKGKSVHELCASKPLSQLRQALVPVMATCWSMGGWLKQACGDGGEAG